MITWAILWLFIHAVYILHDEERARPALPMAIVHRMAP